jgi:hypothetical protein
MLTRAMVTDAFRGSVAVRAGDLSPTILRGPYWRRIFRDVYIPSNVEGRPLSAVPRSGAHPALPEEDVVVRGGLRLTTAARTAWDLARQPDLVEAVVALDALAGSRLVTLPELQLRLDEAYARKGSRRARRAIGLMDPRAESYPEFSAAGAAEPAARRRLAGAARYRRADA